MKFMRSDTEIEINCILRKNKSILKMYFEAGKFAITRTQLIDKGFRFDHFTNKMMHQDCSQTFDFSYEFGIGQTAKDCFQIVCIPL
jgi:hypothetical protein